MSYTLYKVIKEKFSGEVTVILSTNDKEYAEDTLNTSAKQASDDELFKIVED